MMWWHVPRVRVTLSERFATSSSLFSSIVVGVHNLTCDVSKLPLSYEQLVCCVALAVVGV